MPLSVKKPHTLRSSGPIGVFDSGVGGLSTLRHLERLMPHEQFVFLADQAYVPYGEKSERQLRLRCARVIRFLQKHRIKTVVIACNTATCYAIEHLRSRFSLPFIGTVPAVKTACARSRNGSVAVLSTPATAKSAMLKTMVEKKAGHCRVLCIGCAGLEEAVEHGSVDSDKTRALVRSYVRLAREAGVDQLVLGCTHYPFLKKVIRDAFAVSIVDAAPSVARQTRNVLSSAGLLRRSGTSSVTYFTTGSANTFSSVASKLLGRTVKAKKAII